MGKKNQMPAVKGSALGNSVLQSAALTQYLPDHEMNFSVKIYTKAFPSAS